jgi:acyl-CoA thioester hydrolase
MQPYTKKVQYYETDMMGIAHHANYIRWMEEARIDFLDRMGFPYARMEAEGIISPVRAVSCQYKRPCTFGDTIEIAVAVDSFNGVVLTLRYDMTNTGSGELVCQAKSEQVFMRRGGGILRMKRDMPEFTAAIEGMCPKP